MAQQVTVLAIRDFLYQDRMIRSGEWCDMPPVEAAVQKRRGHVSLTRQMAAEPAAASEPAPRRRRQYKRRDLVAEA